MTEPAEVDHFLAEAARTRGVSVVELLRRTMHVGTVRQDPRFVRLFAAASADTLALLDRLDHHVRVANPGLHYVFRATYMGYRREDSPDSHDGSERAQVFLSLVPRIGGLLLVLPVDPAPFRTMIGVEPVGGKGHHGRGDLSVWLGNAGRLDWFLETFGFWIDRN